MNLRVSKKASFFIFSRKTQDLKTRGPRPRVRQARLWPREWQYRQLVEPKKTDLISFAVTQRGLEDYCFSHSNLIGALDEEGRALSGTGKYIKPSQLPYQLTSGRGTFRSQKAIRDPDLQNLTWLLPFISTGEKPLDDPKTESARMEGAQVRMAPIPVPPGGDGGILNRLDGSHEEIASKAHLLVRKVEETLAENYGVVMPAYLGKLCAAAILQGTARSTDYG